MPKKQISAKIEEKLLEEAKERGINKNKLFEDALAEKLGYKVERGTRLHRILNVS